MTMESVGLDELGKMLAELENEAQAVASEALFEGAGLMADMLNAGVDSIQTAPFQYAAGGEKRKPSPQEKAALERKVGIAAFRKDGSEVDTVVGIAHGGYTQISGKQKAVAVIARSVNSGTSFMEKQPVFRRAMSKGKSAAAAAIIQKAEELLNQYTK